MLPLEDMVPREDERDSKGAAGESCVGHQHFSGMSLTRIPRECRITLPKTDSTALECEKVCCGQENFKKDWKSLVKAGACEGEDGVV